jgi:hypothetical protein
MGHHCHTDICQNIVNLYEYFGSLLPSDEVENEDETDRVDHEWEATAIAKAGWKLDHIGFDGDSEAKELGKRGRLNAFHVLTKGDFTCWLINSSQYSNVSEYEWTLIGETPEAAAEFVSDAYNDLAPYQREIHDIDSVQSWG